MKRLFYLLITLTIFIAGCQNSSDVESNEATEENEVLSIYTSIYALADFTSKIGGDFVEAESIYPPNADAHSYELSSNDMVKVAQADAFIYSGVGMEPFADQIESALANEDVHILGAGADLSLRGESAHEHGEHEHDDHEHEDHEHEDHGHGEKTISIEGVAHHYHTGDEVNLTASIEEDKGYDHWHWYTREPGGEEWAVVPELAGPEYTAIAESNGLEVKVALFNDEHEIYAESESIEIVIDDHHGDHEHGNHEQEDHEHGEHEHDDHEHGDHEHGNHGHGEKTISIEGVAHHYHTGDEVNLTASIEEDEGYDHWHWYAREPGEEEWEVVPELAGPEYTAIAESNGLEVKVALFNDEHEIYAESEPVEMVIDDHDGDHGIGDPHVFLDPIISIDLANKIKEMLAELLPEQKSYFEENFVELTKQLEELDQQLEETISNADHNQIIVSHAAYGYWEQRYGLEQLSILGLSSTQEPSQAQLVDLVNVANENNLKYVTFENNVSSTIAEVIQSEIGAESLILRNMESITQEDLDNGEDYISMMKKNIETLEEALNY
ncbi:metal ABC transporter metal-binding protein [Bacillus sp. TS-2]|nr:metal ABC transporter metal-binding protein [Bacillus sp. TS-2]